MFAFSLLVIGLNGASAVVNLKTKNYGMAACNAVFIVIIASILL